MEREMKDSGIEWIGEIPETWNIVRGKYLLILLSKPVKENDGVITCFRDGEVTLRSNRREDGFTMSDKEIGYQGVDVGDLVVHGMDGFAGSIGISDSRGKASPVLNVLDTKQNRKYIMYYLRSMAYNNVFTALATGIRVRSCDLRWNKLAELFYLIPLLQEQNKIADYLDKKCAEIDSLSMDIQTQISILEDYKKSVITEAVTKGLNPDVEMKDSGIEWIGEIPSDWKITHFKYVGTVKSNLVNVSLYQDYPQISPDNIAKDSGILLEYNTVEEAGVISDNHLFYKGQILYSKIRPKLNKAIIAPFDGLCSADMYPIETKECSKFVLYMILSQYFFKQVTLVTEDRVKMPKINQEELGKINVVWPTRKRQEDIAKYLDSKCSEINGAIEDKQKQLEVLEQYKKSLIYEYVTGKREVPDNNG